ncbi:bifunctional arginine demethylase and lysyl-hydroxylase JMJD6 isoform X2 [Exaiptasia diaphana]|uniref:Cupin-like domain-containing protein n=1 Tax=Exaiptasia diaphana TaxID=2652724 RepID=A0A913XWK0_EXADI|nr:bifunctional arginine demethylase and lysyl-hydroxylase JMJD6 isoform X2 [Exaiptasia diaphana]
MAEVDSNEQQVLEAFKTLRLKARKLGIKDSTLSKVNSVSKLKKPSRAMFFGAILVCALAIVIGCGVLAFKKEVITARMVAHFIADKILDFELEKETCFFPIPEIVLDIFRPPVDCSICKNVSSVDRVRNISPKEFLDKYAYTARPVVIEDGMSNWTAHKYFSFDFFKKIYSPNSPVMKSRDPQCQFFPYKTNFASLEEVFQMPEKDAKMEGKPWYIGWSNCDSEAANVLRKHYKRPYFLPENSESSKTDWIFMGCPGYGAHLHIDQVGNPSWQAQVKGTKKWTLEPPPECAHHCPPRMETIIHPGEIIVLDTNKWILNILFFFHLCYIFFN